MTTRVRIAESTAFIETLQQEDDLFWLFPVKENISWTIESGPPLNAETEDVTIITSHGDEFTGCYVYGVEDGAIKIGVC